LNVAGEKEILIIIWDWDKMTKNDYVGEVRMQVNIAFSYIPVKKGDVKNQI
jgi:hypothetical protein